MSEIYSGQTGTFKMGELPTSSPTEKAAKTQILDPQEVGLEPTEPPPPVTPPQGQAQSVSSFVESAAGQEVRGLLGRNKFDDVEARLNRMTVSQLQSLDMTQTEITDLAKGLGSGSWVPLSYSGSEKEAVKKAIFYSNQLTAEQKIALLKEHVGTASIREYVMNASRTELQQLSVDNRMEILNLLDSSNSVSGAVKEVVDRRILGNAPSIDEQMVTQLLLSTPGEADKLRLLGKINQFNRDDAVYAYVLALRPEQLARHSDHFKHELLKHLVDASIDVGITRFDFNAMHNMDEVLEMVSAEHVQAARKLYQSMTFEAQASQSVQETVKQSDALVQEIARIRQDIQSGKVNLENIGAYQSQIATLKATYGNRPELLELEQTLNTLRTQLQQANQMSTQISSSLDRSTQNLNSFQNRITQIRKEVGEVQQTMATTRARIDTAKENMFTQYEQLLTLKGQLGDLGTEYGQLLQEFRQTLNNQTIDDSQRLEQLNHLAGRLTAIEAQNQAIGAEHQQTLQAVKTLESQLQSERLKWNTNVAQLLGLSGRQHQLSEDLNRQLSRFEQHITTMENTYVQAQTQISQQETNLSPEEMAALQAEIQKAGRLIDTHQQFLQETRTYVKHDLQANIEHMEKELKELEPDVQQVQQTLQVAEQSLEEMARFAPAVNILQETINSTLEQMKSSIARWQSQVSQASATEINGIISDLEKARTELQKLDHSPERAEMEQKLTQLLQTYHQLKSDIAQIKSGNTALSSQMDSLSASKSQLDQSISQSTQAVQTAETLVIATHQEVQKLQQKLTETTEKIASHTQQIQDFQQQWDLNQKTIQEIKQAYQAGNLDVGVFTHQLAEIETQQSALDQQMKVMGTQITLLQNQLSTQQHALLSAQTSLTQTSTQLAATQTQLQQRITQSKGDLADKQQLLAQLQRELQTGSTEIDNVTLRQLKSDIQQQMAILETKIQERVRLIEEAEQTLSHLQQENPQGKISDAQNQLNIALQTLDSLKADELAKSKEKWQNLSGVLDEHRQAVQQAGRDVTLLLNQLKGDGEPVQAYSVMEQIDQLIQDPRVTANDRETLLRTRRTIQDIASRTATANEHRDTVLTASQTARQQAADARESTLAFQDTLSQIEQNVQQAETQVNNSQEQLLDMHRQLLSHRENLAIEDLAYQQMLGRYREILNSGSTPTATDLRELESLETRLGQLETLYAGLNRQVESQLLQLNALKENMNAQLEELESRTQELQSKRSELAQAHVQLETSQQHLQQQNDELTAKRNTLMQDIQRLEEMRDRHGIGNLKELQDLLNSLYTELGNVNTEIQRNQEVLRVGQSALEESGTVLRDMDASLIRAQALKTHLKTIQARIDDLILMAGNMQVDLQGLLDRLSHLQQNIQTLSGQLDELIVIKPSPPSVSNTQPEQAPLAPIEPSLGKKIAHFLGFSNHTNPPRRNNEEKQEEFIKELNQQLQQSREREKTTAEELKAIQAEKAMITRIVQSAYAGVENTSGVNIIGIDQILTKTEDH